MTTSRPKIWKPNLRKRQKLRRRNKEAILALLTTNFAEVQKEMETARNGFLSSQAELFGKPTTKRGVFTWLDAAIAEQLGQVIAFGHANGVAIPWTGAELH